jgi:hypothetical protein
MCRLLAASHKLAERRCDIRLVRGGERRGLLANLLRLLDLLQRLLRLIRTPTTKAA